MSLIFSFLTSRLGLGILLAIVAVLGALAFVKGQRNIGYEQAVAKYSPILAKAEAELEVCQGINTELKALTDKQNGAIEAMQGEAARRKAEGAAAAAAAGKGFMSEAAKILGTPKLDADVCKSAEKRIDAELGLK